MKKKPVHITKIPFIKVKNINQQFSVMWHKPSKGVMADLRQKSTPDLKFLILSNSYGDTRFSINITLIDMENFILYYSYKSTTSSLHLASLRGSS